MGLSIRSVFEDSLIDGDNVGSGTGGSMGGGMGSSIGSVFEDSLIGGDGIGLGMGRSVGGGTGLSVGPEFEDSLIGGDNVGSGTGGSLGGGMGVPGGSGTGGDVGGDTGAGWVAAQAGTSVAALVMASAVALSCRQREIEPRPPSCRPIRALDPSFRIRARPRLPHRRIAGTAAPLGIPGWPTRTTPGTRRHRRRCHR